MSRTLDLPITISDVLPLSYRRLVGAKAIKLGSCDKRERSKGCRKSLEAFRRLLKEAGKYSPEYFRTMSEDCRRLFAQFLNSEGVKKNHFCQFSTSRAFCTLGKDSKILSGGKRKRIHACMAQPKQYCK